MRSGKREKRSPEVQEVTSEHGTNSLHDVTSYGADFDPSTYGSEVWEDERAPSMSLLVCLGCPCLSALRMMTTDLRSGLVTAVCSVDDYLLLPPLTTATAMPSWFCACMYLYSNLIVCVC